MRTDTLLDDDDLDRALRDMAPVGPVPPGWEHAQREQLIAFIARGHLGTEIVEPADEVDVAAGIDVPLLDAVRPRASLGRSRVLLAVAACAVIIAGLAATLRTRDAGSPADQSSSTVVVTTDPVDDTTSGFDPLRPDVYPVITPGSPGADDAVGSYGGPLVWEGLPRAEAVVARVTDEGIEDGITLSIGAGVEEWMFGLARTDVTIAGVPMSLYVEGDASRPRAVVLEGPVTYTARGLDPVGFLEEAGGFPITHGKVGTGPNGAAVLELGALPPGYQVVVPPAEIPNGAINAMTHASSPGGGLLATVEVRNPLTAWATFADLRRVDINGVTGWLREGADAPVVIWPVSSTTWAVVSGEPTADATLAFARELEFVDEATWRQRYTVGEPTTQVAPQTTTSVVLEPTTTVSVTLAPTTSAAASASAEPRPLHPTVVPPGFGPIPDSSTTDAEGADPISERTRIFVGPGESPAILVAFVSPETDDAVEDFADFTSDPAWPSYRFRVAMPGTSVLLASGGLSREELESVAAGLAPRAVPDGALPDVELTVLPAGFIELEWTHTPTSARAETWTASSPADARFTMLFESGRGVDAALNGITWPIRTVETMHGTVFVSIDATDPSFVQAGVIIQGQVVQIEAHGISADDVVDVLASLTTK